MGNTQPQNNFDNNKGVVVTQGGGFFGGDHHWSKENGILLMKNLDAAQELKKRTKDLLQESWILVKLTRPGEADRDLYVRIYALEDALLESNFLLSFLKRVSEKGFEQWLEQRETRRLEEKARLENSRRPEKMTRSSRGCSSSGYKAENRQ
jgi:hypothetical protein